MYVSLTRVVEGIHPLPTHFLPATLLVTMGFETTISKLAALPILPRKTSGTEPGTYVVKPWVEKDSLAGENEGAKYMYKTWFQTPALDPETIRRLRSVQLFAESRDQGFCDDSNAGTWTWFELAIMENQHATIPRIKDGITLAWISHKNHLIQKKKTWKTGINFGKDHDIFRLLEDGNVIAVRLCARFPCWEVTVRGGYLRIELGDQVERNPLQFGQVISSVQAVQNVFQDINSVLVEDGMQIAELPAQFFTANMMLKGDDRPLRVLSLDGGGVRGIAALMLLDEIMKKSYPGKLPHEVFDMIGGTSTGGFIAVMLGLMKMNVRECIESYSHFMTVVFPSKGWWASKAQSGKSVFTGAKWDDKPLVKVIRDLVELKLGNPDILLLDESNMHNSCKVFLMAVNQTGSNNHAPVMLRTYQHPLEMPALPKMKLWEACRATSAAPSFFQPMTIGDKTFLDGGLQANNPLGWMWNEVLTVYGPRRNTCCFLSIGTGTPKSEKVADSTLKQLPGFAKSMASIATNTEVTNILFRSLINAFAPHPNSQKYFRFNIGDGCPEWVPNEDGTSFQWVSLENREEQALGELDDVSAMKKTIEATNKYIGLKGAQQLMAECAKSLVTASA